MDLGQTLAEAARRLKTAQIENPRLEAEILLCWATGFTRPYLLARLEEELSPQAARKFWPAVKRRSGGYPIQYLTGCQEFMSLNFTVNPSVLIPRQDTTILVEAVLERLRPDGKYSIADIGTGSGIIALSLARYLPAARLYATDISREALEVARWNACRLGLAERVVFYEGDLLSPLEGGIFDVIAANPPYVPTPCLDNLPVEVGFEPRPALDGGEDGLDYYRRLLPGAGNLLQPGGFIALEIGYNQGMAVKKLASTTGLYRDMVVLPDYGGRDRCFLAYCR